MLKITKAITTGNKTIFQLEGRLIGEWVTLLRETNAAVEPSTLVLDLSGVSYASSDGLALLLAWQKGGANLRNASIFLVEMLRQAKSMNDSPASFASVEQDASEQVGC